MTSESTTIKYERGDDDIVVLTLDDPNQSANTMNAAYIASMGATVQRLEAEKDDIKGVVITSAKKTFFAGGDLNDLKAVTKEHAAEFAAGIREVKAQLRRLETLGVPVVAAINGAALGGGLEITLAAHHRIVVDDPKAKLGFPEVKLGLLPGGGGVVRTVRMFGIVDALMQLLLQGQEIRPAKALEMGLVGEVVATRDELVPAAKQWIAANPQAVQPWDVKGYKIPGGTPSNPSFAANLPAFPANLRKQIKGANMPAPRAILAAAIEGAQVDFDTAIQIETRYFIHLATGQVSKNMTKAFFFDLQTINSGGSRPDGFEKYTAKKVGVLGAGMMGAGIAYSAARSGIQVVLKDVSIEAAEKGKAHSATILDKAISRGKLSEAKKAEILARITPTADPADLAGCDSVIEAVFEDPSLKAKVYGEVQDVVN
ncbi:MAG TPA: enoyl-CoA hydratase-related protein, partial [Baekduia sp.]|nr:enoyl-CoA hydratase-related protein [Baekduia sp.]